MCLQWSEIRARAAAFSERWQDAGYEKSETHTFYNEFFVCFGVNRRQVAGCPDHDEAKGDGRLGCRRRAFRDGG